MPAGEWRTSPSLQCFPGLLQSAFLNKHLGCGIDPKVYTLG